MMQQTPFEQNETRLNQAMNLMNNFLLSTGVKGARPSKRYLWTDALAVENLIQLELKTGEQAFTEYALELIDMVHNQLGRFDAKDKRKGWISTLSNGEAKIRPTAGGLRIGKPKLERAIGESFSSIDEWDRDGQYFHYLTRWIDALLLVGSVTNDGKYQFWAADLCHVTMKAFIKDLRIPWKMSIDLKRPLISDQGATDPLDGLITIIKVCLAVPELKKELKEFELVLQRLCRNTSWVSADPLGIGRLLISAHQVKNLPNSESKGLDWKDLLAQACVGIDNFLEAEILNSPAGKRLAFRECALAHGIKYWHNEPRFLEKYFPLADELESFWLNEMNSDSWKDHEEINCVTLAASLLN